MYEVLIIFLAKYLIYKLIFFGLFSHVKTSEKIQKINLQVSSCFQVEDHNNWVAHHTDETPAALII